ncbi:MAG: amidohydrolase [bacterium]|nr:amidohydrolase [bacterium]
MRRLILAFVFAAAALTAQQQPTLIRGATVLTVTGGVIENGSVLIRDGKIAAVGETVEAPAGARIIDATGHYLTPGIVDCHTHIAADSINEGSVPVSSMVSIVDVLDPTDINIYRALAGGVTTANILHGSANPIGGQCVVLKMRWGADAKGLIFEGALPGLKFAMGENPKGSNSSRNRPAHPASRQGVADVIRQAFHQAREYRRRWTEYDTSKAAGNARAVPPRRDLQMEPLVEILEGKRLVHAHCYRADEILALLRVAEEAGFRIQTLQHVLEGYKVADEIAAHGAGASTFSDWWAYKMEAYDAIPHNTALMAARGVLVSINSDGAEEMQHLNREAAKTMKWGGLSAADALALITINPAKQLKIGKRVGSIETGKDADLVIWDRHPLSAYAKALNTFVDGSVYFDREQDIKRRAKLKKEKDELLAKEKEASKKKSPKPKESPSS